MLSIVQAAQWAIPNSILIKTNSLSQDR